MGFYKLHIHTSYRRLIFGDPKIYLFNIPNLLVHKIPQTSLCLNINRRRHEFLWKIRKNETRMARKWRKSTVGESVRDDGADKWRRDRKPIRIMRSTCFPINRTTACPLVLKPFQENPFTWQLNRVHGGFINGKVKGTRRGIALDN